MRILLAVSCFVSVCALRSSAQRQLEASQLDARRTSAISQHIADAHDGMDQYIGSLLAEIDSSSDSTSPTGIPGNETVFLESGVGKVYGYCEICIRILQMYQRGLPDVCAGLTDTFFITVCIITLIITVLCSLDLFVHCSAFSVCQEPRVHTKGRQGSVILAPSRLRS